MDPVIIDAGVVGFNRDERTAVGLVLPYGEECRSSVGRFTFDEGVCTIPEDVPGIVGFNIEHQREEPIGRAIAMAETPQGIVGTFRIADGPEGDAALADIASGKRKHLSAEVKGLRIKGGKAIAASLFGAALVAEPAFPSAGLFAAADTDAAAADTADPDDGDEELLEEHTSTDEWTDENGKTWKRTTNTKTVRVGNETRSTSETVLEEPEPQAETPEEGTMAATAPVGFSAPAAPAARTEERNIKNVDKATFFSALLRARRSGNYNDPILSGLTETEERVGMFALPDAKYDAAAGDAGTYYLPQYLQEIWEGDDDPAERRIVPLLDHGDLTELYFDDSEWTAKATVARWDGNKSNVTGTAPKRARRDPERAQGFAGGLDIALEHKFFNHEQDIEEFVTQMRDSYAVESDKYVAEKLVAVATETLYVANPEVREVFVKLVQGILAVRRVGKARPTFALLAEDMYEQYLYTPKDKVLEFLSASAGIDEGEFSGIHFEPWETLTEGQVLVGARKSAKVLELPGAPIRLNALDLARGGHDEALFGFVGFRRQRPAALSLVVDELTPEPAP